MTDTELTPLAQAVNEVINRHNLAAPDHRMVIGVSGGSDSVGLLHLMAEIFSAAQLVAVYVDHGLRPGEIDEEKRAIAKICAALGVTIRCVTVAVNELAEEEHRSIEESARILRYRALEGIRKEEQAHHIAVGHTADDQVEEFFIRLIRGSGLKGFAGMQICHGRIIRPLLLQTKSEVKSYLQTLGVGWCLDSSNLDRRFLRNRIRLELLPMLRKEFNPAIDRRVLNTMDIIKNDDDFLEQFTADRFRRCTSEENDGGKNKKILVQSNALLSEHPAIARRILEKCFWAMAIRPDFEQITTITTMLENYSQDRRNQAVCELHLPDGVRLYLKEDILVFSRPLAEGATRGSAPAPAPYRLMVEGPGCYPVAAIGKTVVLTRIEADAPAIRVDKTGTVLSVAVDNLQFPLEIRPFYQGEKFTPFHLKKKKKIARYFNEKAIPSRLRSSWPLLVHDNEVVAVIGLEIDYRFRLQATSRTILQIELVDTDSLK
ncbi:tRNA lysidine(34) synthetase TilS [Desulforhopalus singaporensis]|uniref:tRNA(Ile)-lysidine synthase n=1 Tax=Desulforhopalus singaporensis TaxID=91360 RepID=A0A1H0P305_9BACT|nr:tRNA lysidine(34) synthetase TilS [Desulforhopalus singaporensis]SDO99343.1 tRNA(Ile)-lysidine synthase [Desulforhopalus singaporensis]